MPTRALPKEALSSPASWAARRGRERRSGSAASRLPPMVQRLLRPIIGSLPCAQFPSALPRRRRPVVERRVDAEQPLRCGRGRRGEARLLEPDGPERRDGLCTVAARSRRRLASDRGSPHSSGRRPAVDRRRDGRSMREEMRAFPTGSRVCIGAPAVRSESGGGRPSTDAGVGGRGRVRGIASLTHPDRGRPRPSTSATGSSPIEPAIARVGPGTAATRSGAALRDLFDAVGRAGCDGEALASGRRPAHRPGRRRSAHQGHGSAVPQRKLSSHVSGSAYSCHCTQRLPRSGPSYLQLKIHLLLVGTHR